MVLVFCACAAQTKSISQTMMMCDPLEKACHMSSLSANIKSQRFWWRVLLEAVEDRRSNFHCVRCYHCVLNATLKNEEWGMAWQGTDSRCFKYWNKNGPRCSHIPIIAIIQSFSVNVVFYNCCTLLKRCCEALNKLFVRVTLHQNLILQLKLYVRTKHEMTTSELPNSLNAVFTA